MDYLDTIAYYASRLMYSLNTYGTRDKMFYEKNKTILYGGKKLPYSSLLPYIRNVGKIILFSSFISTFELKLIADNFSGRGRQA